MVVKTELCTFSQLKIYPGRGVKFVAKDGRVSLFLSKRNRCYALRKIKAQRLRWATAWRRLHKKIKQTDLNKRQKKKALKVERAIEGVTLESIKKIKQAKPQDKKALAEQAIREIKERKKAQISKRVAQKKTQNKDKNVAQKAADKAANKAAKKNKKK